MKLLSGAPLYCMLLASPANIRPGRNELPGTNTPAYYKNSQITALKKFYEIDTHQGEVSLEGSDQLFKGQGVGWVPGLVRHGPTSELTYHPF